MVHRQKRAVKSARTSKARTSKARRQKRKVLKHDVLNSVCKNVVLLKNAVVLNNIIYYKNKINTYSTMLFSVQILKQIKIMYHRFLVLNFAKLLEESLKGGDFHTSASRRLAFYSTGRTLLCLRLRLVLLLKTVPHIAQCFLFQFESD